jgi:hypothetical protein
MGWLRGPPHAARCFNAGCPDTAPGIALTGRARQDYRQPSAAARDQYPGRLNVLRPPLAGVLSKDGLVAGADAAIQHRAMHRR